MNNPFRDYISVEKDINVHSLPPQCLRVAASGACAEASAAACEARPAGAHNLGLQNRRTKIKSAAQ